MREYWPPIVLAVVIWLVLIGATRLIYATVPPTSCQGYSLECLPPPPALRP